MLSDHHHVSINGLAREFGGRTVLSIDSLHIRPGEHVALVGRNGAGKSTLLNCLAGRSPNRTGSVRVLSTHIDANTSASQLREFRQKVGHLMQGLHMVPRLSALDNVVLGALGRMVGKDLVRSWIRFYDKQTITDASSALDQVGLGVRAAVRTDRLSGGERQKVAIARLLMQRPALILADEPTASLDPTAAEDVCRLLRSAADGKTLITVVHNTELLPLIADRVIGLKAGLVEFDVPLSEVNASRLEFLYDNSPPRRKASDAQPDVVRELRTFDPGELGFD